MLLTRCWRRELCIVTHVALPVDRLHTTVHEDVRAHTLKTPSPQAVDVAPFAIPESFVMAQFVDLLVARAEVDFAVAIVWQNIIMNAVLASFPQSHE